MKKRMRYLLLPFALCCMLSTSCTKSDYNSNSRDSILNNINDTISEIPADIYDTPSEKTIESENMADSFYSHGLFINFPNGWVISEIPPTVHIFITEYRINNPLDEGLYFGIQISPDIGADDSIGQGLDFYIQEIKAFWEFMGIDDIIFGEIYINDIPFFMRKMPASDNSEQQIISTVKNDLRYDIFAIYKLEDEDFSQILDSIFSSVTINPL